MRLRTGSLVALIVCAFAFAAIAFGPSASAQTALQAFAQQKYNEYLAAHENAWRAGAQGSPQYPQLLEFERYKWNEYTAAQAAANAEANQIAVQHNIAQVDAVINAWVNHIQTLYNRRDVNAYANDPNYRAQFDYWVQQQAAYGNNYIAQLQAYRAQFAGAQNPPQPPACNDPRYCGPSGNPGDGPISVSPGPQ